MKRAIAIIFLLTLSGCGPWNDAQSALTTQARRGVANLSNRIDARQQSIRDLARLRRDRLDEAFDQDARQRPALDAGWVIEHRKAYAAALDAYLRHEAGEQAALEAEKRDLQAVDAALQRLLWLQSIQSKFDLLGEVFDAKH